MAVHALAICVTRIQITYAFSVLIVLEIPYIYPHYHITANYEAPKGLSPHPHIRCWINNHTILVMQLVPSHISCFCQAFNLLICIYDALQCKILNIACKWKCLFLVLNLLVIYYWMHFSFLPASTQSILEQKCMLKNKICTLFSREN